MVIQVAGLGFQSARFTADEIWRLNVTQASGEIAETWRLAPAAINKLGRQ